MSEKFIPLAQSRAGYYCKGSPVHFVMVELFRMESTGATVVTLTFKNLFSHPLMSFTAFFRCKNRKGEVIVEDSFTYHQVNAGEGECFGCDDAVFVSDEPLSSVEVRLGSVTYDDGIAHDLRRCTPVSLPPLRPLSEQERTAVCALLHTQDARYYPEEAENGWRCTCGAFNYNAGKGKYRCSECGAEKPVMISAVRNAQHGNASSGAQYDSKMQFLPVQDVPGAPGAESARGKSTQYAVHQDHAEMHSAHPASESASGSRACLMKDSTADFILRYAPFITMAAAAVFTMGAVIIAQMMM